MTPPQDRPAKLGWVLLAHEAPTVVAEQARALLASDPDGAILLHYDGAAPAERFAALQAALPETPRLIVLEDRVPSGWGQFGLVEACLRALRRSRGEGLDVDFHHLVSVSCAPVRPIAAFKAFLAANRDRDFLECAGPDWIIGGLREERYTLFHLFNERRYRTAFYLFAGLQRLVGVRRRPPLGITPRFGSQWWTLRRETTDALLDLLDQRPEVERFFRKTWVPDEIFFPSLVNHMKGGAEISGHNLTFYKFTNQGKPIVFYDDGYDFLTTSNFFFARKIAPGAAALRARLWRQAAEPDVAQPFAPGARTLSYELRMRAQSQPGRPGAIFFGDQFADQSERILARMRAPCLVVWSLPSAQRALAVALPAPWRAVWIGDRPDGATGSPGEAAALGALWGVSPSLAVARAAEARGDVVMLPPDCPADLLDLLARNERVTLVSAFPEPGAARRWRRWIAAAALLRSGGAGAVFRPEELDAEDPDLIMDTLTEGLGDDPVGAAVEVRLSGEAAASGWRTSRPLTGAGLALTPALDACLGARGLRARLLREDLATLPRRIRRRLATQLPPAPPRPAARLRALPPSPLAVDADAGALAAEPVDAANRAAPALVRRSGGAS